MSDLFDWAARTTDPVESQIAAKVIKPNLPKLRRMFVDSCRALGGGTAQEIAWHATTDATVRESIRKRATECVRDGLVYRSVQRQCKVTGQVARVFVVVGGKF